ncbi:MAG: hypothetical protein WB784_11570 [Rhodanobacteraceae bacterium]
MSYDILKNLGLDHLDVNSPDFLETLQRMQKEALRSLQPGADEPKMTGSGTLKG